MLFLIRLSDQVSIILTSSYWEDIIVRLHFENAW